MLPTAVASLLLAAVSAAPHYDFEWTGALGKGSLIEIRGINGNLRAEPSRNGQVEVTAVFNREDGETAPVKVRVEESGGGLTVCAVNNGQDMCAPAGTQGGPSTRIDFLVRVPEGVSFRGLTVNGGIDVDSLSSDVEAYTVNGRVDVSTSGTARIRTVNGSIAASLLQPFWSKPQEFSAVNGEITVRIPRNVNAEIHAETRNGKIRSVLQPFKGKATDQTLDGSIGSGAGNSLSIRTVNGSIDLLSRT